MNPDQNNIDYKKLYLKYKNKYLEKKKIEDNSNEDKIYSNNYIAKSTILNGGYGVFANKDYKNGDIVEKNKFLEYIDNKSGLENYKFKSHKNGTKSLIVLGNGCMFNHNDNNNLDYYYSNDFYTFWATRDIKKDEELFIYYGDNWFSSRNYTKGD